MSPNNSKHAFVIYPAPAQFHKHARNRIFRGIHTLLISLFDIAINDKKFDPRKINNPAANYLAARSGVLNYQLNKKLTQQAAGN